jgi:hypothetical protein
MAIPEKTPSESLRENDEARLARIAKKNAKARERIAIDALTKLKQLFERDAAGCESIPNGYLVSRKLIDFADRCAQALNGDITDGHCKRDATDVVFEIQTDLNREATGWEKDYFPVSDLYNGLAKECSKEWHRAIAREKSGEQSDNSIPPTVSHFDNPPKRKHDLWLAVEPLVNRHFEENEVLPTVQELWDRLVGKNKASYSIQGNSISGFTRGRLRPPLLRKRLGEWGYKKVD